MSYLAIQHSGGTLVLHDDGDTSAYHMESAAFPAPVKRSPVELAMRYGANLSGPLDELAERTIVVDCTGDTEADAEDSLLALQRAVDSHRAKLLWQSSSASPMIWTTIRNAEVREETVSRPHRTDGLLRVTLTLVTDSEWTGASVAFTGDEVVVSDGDRPARLRLKLTSASANPCLGLGIKSSPGADYSPVDTVGSPAAVNLTSTYANLHTAAAIDTAANTGSHLAVAKVATNATAAASTRYRAVASVTGSGMSDSSLATHNSTAALATTARYTPLPGLVRIPAGGVPGIQTGSGFSAEAVQIENDVDDGTRTLQAGTLLSNPLALVLDIAQSFTTYAGRVTAFEYTIDSEPTAAVSWTLELRNASGAVVASVSDPDMTAGTHKVSIPATETPAGETWSFALVSEQWSTTFSVGLAYSNGDYAGGALTTPEGSGESPGDDLTFAVYGKLALGFDSTVTVQGNCSEESKTATLSEVVLLPADHFAATYEHAFGADEGVLIENTDPLGTPAAYLTTSTEGTAGPAVAPSAYYGSPRLPVGSNLFVTAADGTLTISGEYMPCWSNAAAGRL